MKSNSVVVSEVIKQSAKGNVFPVLKIPIRINSCLDQALFVELYLFVELKLLENYVSLLL